MVTLFEKISGLSIKHKILVINLTAITVALFIAVAVAVSTEYADSRNAAIESLEVQSAMVAKNTSAALVFGDEKGAWDVLQAFSASSHVVLAVIYDAEGIELASYVNPRLHRNEVTHEHIHSDHAEPDLHEDTSDLNNKLHLVQNIIFDNKIVGRLFIEADISYVYEDIFNYLVFMVLVALASLLFATILLVRLSRTILSPIGTLIQLMERVKQKDDYSIRSDNISGDEIGLLTQHFNNMLEHIQINDEQLEHELTERYKAEAHLDKLAYYDVTTGLPNRHFFQKHLSNAVKRAIEDKQKMVLMFLDLDNFKAVNDTLGHATGDVLLKQAAVRLSKVLRRNDHICRIGGDEFAIIIENIDEVDVTSVVIEKCFEAFSKPFVFDENKFFVGVSIGVSVCPDDATTINTLLVNADMAMYDAKERGKNNYQFYNRAMNESHSRKYLLLNDLRNAITHNQLELYYQPQVNSQDGSLVGAEALMRWNHPINGLIPPDEFIPISEESGMILLLGEWLINAACGHIQRFRQSGLKDFTVAINISSLQIREENFVDMVSDALERAGLESTCLELEITESTLMDDSEFVIDKLKKLKSRGIKISIDDFGTGYSSMSYLKNFPVNTLKIDKSFVSGLPDSVEDKAITSAIITMAKGLDISVVAEGVENQEQAALLKSYNCDVLQGYYYSRPVPLHEFIANYGQQETTDHKFKIIKGGSLDS